MVIERKADSVIVGYGEEALYEMDEAARQLLCKKCVLFVADANVNARKLYEKCGYIYRNEREMAELDNDTQTRMSEWYDILKNAGFIGTQTPGLPYHISHIGKFFRR